MSLPIYRLPPSRIPELLESLKTEFESLAHEANLQKMQKEELERKLSTQYNELTTIQNAIFELERSHTALKKQYEEENNRLKRQLESANFHSNGTDERTSEKSSTEKRSFPSNPTSSALPSSATRDKRQRTEQNDQSNFYPSSSTSLSTNPSSLPSFSLAEAASLAKPLAIPNSSSSINPKPEKLDPNFIPLPTPFAKNELNGPPRSIPIASQNNGIPSIVESKDMFVGKNPPEKSRNNGRDLPESGEPPDWIVGYHQSVSPNLEVSLGHTHDHSSVVCCVKFSQDGKWMATGCNRSAQVFDVETGEQIYTFTDESVKDEDLYIRSVCFSPDGQFLATGAEDKTVKIWDIEHKSIKRTFTGHEVDIYSLDYSPLGNIIVSGSGDKKARIWDVETGTCLQVLGTEDVGPKDGVTSVAISPDGRYVAAGSLDRVVRLWEVSTGFFVDRYEGHTDSVYSVAFSPDGKSLASGSLDKSLKLWDLSANRPRARSTFVGHKDFVLSVAFSPDGNWLVSGSKDRTVQFWDPRTSIAYMKLEGHKNSVISVAMNPAGGTFATGSGDFRSRIWRYKHTFP